MTQELSQTDLLRLFTSAFILGYALGILYEIFRLRRRASRGSDGKNTLVKLLSALAIGFEDLLFFLVAGVLTSVMFFALFQGRVRIAAIVLEGAGFIAYRLSLGRLVTKVADAVIALVRKVRHFIFVKFIKPPARALYRLFERAARRAGRRATARARKRISKKMIGEIYKASERGFMR